MYCVYDSNNNVVAFHDDLDIVEIYVKHVIDSHRDQPDDCPDLHIGKIKKKKLKNITDLDHLYLVRYADTYVQAGYLEYLEVVSSHYIHDEQQCKDILLRILECRNLTGKERKSIEKTVSIIDKFLTESKQYTPTLRELKSYESEYAPYLYNRNVY